MNRLHGIFYQKEFIINWIQPVGGKFADIYE